MIQYDKKSLIKWHKLINKNFSPCVLLSFLCKKGGGPPRDLCNSDNKKTKRIRSVNRGERAGRRDKGGITLSHPHTVPDKAFSHNPGRCHG